jgi:hypothetical protein
MGLTPRRRYDSIVTVQQVFRPAEYVLADTTRGRTPSMLTSCVHCAMMSPLLL